jgi:hypothetical protein
MAARGKGVVYVPGKGTTVSGPKGAKKFTGKGPGPSGTTKTPERSYSEVPIVTVSPSGATTTSNFPSERAARRAKRAQRTTKKRVRRIVASVERKAEKRSQVKQPVPKAYKADPAKAALPRKLTPIQKAEQASAEAFNAEGGKQIPVPFKAPAVKVAAHLRAAAVPKAAKRLKTEYRQARKVVAKSSGHLVGDLGPEQRKFVRGVAKGTHLKPRTIAAQARAEEGNAAQTEVEQTHNFLNMGPGIAYPSLKAGVKATVQNYNAAPYYAGVRATRGASAKAQVDAIGASPWGTDPTLIRQTLGEVGFKGKSNPKAERKLARVKVEAKEKGISLPSKAGPAPKKVVTRFKAIKAAADALESKNFPYSWGGGHDASFSPGGEGENGGPGYDCSGAVSFVLHKAGVLSSPLTSGSMGSVLKPGPGAVTVFYNAEHTFMRIGDEYWGTSVGDNGAGGIGKHPAPSAAYLAQYSVGHVPGLGRKQALQLGFKDLNVGSASNFPGMTFSSAGTTATIDPGAGTTKTGKPGFSKMPIQLTPQQRVARTNRKLKALGVGASSTATSQPSSDSVLTALEKKYGTAAV